MKSSKENFTFEVSKERSALWLKIARVLIEHTDELETMSWSKQQRIGLIIGDVLSQVLVQHAAAFFEGDMERARDFLVNRINYNLESLEGVGRKK